MPDLRLQDACTDFVALHMLDAYSWIVIDLVESAGELRQTMASIGSPMLRHAAAVGTLFVAYLPETQRGSSFKDHELRAFIPHTISIGAELEKWARLVNALTLRQ